MCRLAVPSYQVLIMLETAEESLDQVTCPIGLSVVMPVGKTVGAQRDDCLRACGLDAVHQGIGVLWLH